MLLPLPLLLLLLLMLLMLLLILLLLFRMLERGSSLLCVHRGETLCNLRSSGRYFHIVHIICENMYGVDARPAVDSFGQIAASASHHSHKSYLRV